MLGSQYHCESVRMCKIISPARTVSTGRCIHLDFLVTFSCLGTYSFGLVVRVGHYGILIELVLVVHSSVGTLNGPLFVVLGGRSRTFSLGRCGGRGGYVGHGSCSRDLDGSVVESVVE